MLTVSTFDDPPVERMGPLLSPYRAYRAADRPTRRRGGRRLAPGLERRSAYLTAVRDARREQRACRNRRLARRLSARTDDPGG